MKTKLWWYPLSPNENNNFGWYTIWSYFNHVTVMLSTDGQTYGCLKYKSPLSGRQLNFVSFILFKMGECRIHDVEIGIKKKN